MSCLWRHTCSYKVRILWKEFAIPQTWVLMKMAHYKIAIIAILVTNSFWSLSPYWAKWPCPDYQLSHLHLLVFLGRVTSSFVYQLFTSFFYLQYRNLKMNWKFSWYWPMGHQPIQFSYSLTVLNPSLDGVFSFIDSSCGTTTVNHYITSVLPQ